MARYSKLFGILGRSLIVGMRDGPAPALRTALQQFIGGRRDGGGPSRHDQALAAVFEAALRGETPPLDDLLQVSGAVFERARDVAKGRKLHVITEDDDE